MARSSGLTTFGMVAASTLLLGVGIAAAGEKAAIPLSSQDKEAIVSWLDRAEKYAAALPESQLVEVLPTLASVMVDADKTEKIDHLLALIKDPTKRADQDLLVCGCLAAAGKYDAAIRRAQSLPTERRTSDSGERSNSWRDGALYLVAQRQMLSFDFAAAKKTLARINDPETVSTGQVRLAEYQAKAGLYAEAEKSLEEYSPTKEDGKKWKEQTRQLIARYKAERRKDRPPKQSGGMITLEGLRRLGTIFADTGIEIRNLADAEKAEKAAETVKGAVNRAAMWREIAWAYYDMRNKDARNLERCRHAIKKSAQNAEEIPGGLGRSYLKTVAFASAANLYLELGEIETAKQMVKKANAVDLSEDMLGGLNAFTTTPLLIGVLVRVGDIDGALAIAEKLQKVADGKGDAASFTNPDFAWSQWAAFCAFGGETAHVEHQLDKTRNTRIKAVLCAGVAEGLFALRQRPAGGEL